MTMTQLQLCLQTQTPLVRLLRPVPPSTHFDDLHEEKDYLPSPGGVTRMLRGLTKRLESQGRVARTRWVSLAREDARLRWRNGSIELTALPDHERAAYAAAKSAFWDDVHGLRAEAPDVASIREGLAHLGRRIGERSCALHEDAPFDLFYTHDFQLLEAARHLPERIPRAFRWHIPVRASTPELRAYVARALDEYDSIVVSTRAYARELRAWGVRAPIHASYPYLDETRYRVVTQTDVDAFEARHGIGRDDAVFALVARLDPIKSHDVAIRALAQIRRDAPHARLLLVGGGGFSGGRQGLGLPQAQRWRETLETLARNLGVADRVTFTGGIGDGELDVALTRARAVLLPSALEGFGLAAVEGWLYGKPALVSRGAGVAELVRDGENGVSFDPGDDAALAEGMRLFALRPDEAQRMGEEGRHTARRCHLARGADDVWSALSETLRGEPRWERPGTRRW